MNKAECSFLIYYRQHPKSLAYGYSCTCRLPIKNQARISKGYRHPQWDDVVSSVRHTPNPPLRDVFGSPLDSHEN
jgi:hypothetical protein